MQLARGLVTTAGVATVFGAALLAYTCGREGAPGAQGVLDTAQGPTQGRNEGEDPPTARRDMLNDLREAHAMTRDASDGGGRAWLELEEGEEAVVQARRSGTWTIVYEAGPLGIVEGGLMRLTIPRFWEWSAAQTYDERLPGFTVATCEAEGVTLEPYDIPGFWVDFKIRGRALAEGERIRIVYGAGEAGAMADKYAERDSRFWILVDGDGDGFPVVLADSPAVDVVAGPPRHLHLVLPSTAEPGDTVPLLISVLDAYGSAGFPFEGEVELASIQDGLEVPATVTFTAADAGSKKVELELNESAVHRLLGRLVWDESDIFAQSNPMLVEAGVAPVRWADLHGHSNLSDGTATPEDFLAYARDVAGLDIVSLTDHDHWGMLFLDEYPELWEGIQEVTERFHAPGEFVTLLGYEWTNWVHGHRHVVYFEDTGPLYSSIDPEYETPAQLWKGLEGQPALTFAHHSAGGPVATNWDYAPPPELEPITEVSSVHGQSESPEAPLRIYSPLRGNFVRDVLDRGYKLGFIGSNDSHDGHPGLAHLVNPSGGGIGAILTDDLTREGIYAALRERRTYATNGPRIILRTAIDANGMGSSIPATQGDDKPLLYIRAIATAPLLAIEVIRSGAIIEQIPGEELYDLATAVSLEPLEKGEYVYVRVTQADEGVAWSSPFFVE